MMQHIECVRLLSSVIHRSVRPHQIPAVVVPEGGDSAGARVPQQTDTETAVDMHPDLLLCYTSLLLHTDTNRLNIRFLIGVSNACMKRNSADLGLTGQLEQLFHKGPIFPQMFLEEKIQKVDTFKNIIH